jgi:predicted nucleotide-binding protein (sugar kinase/HSP70/actin superfamily)
MFWNLGRKIISAARWAESRKNFSIVYFTNFKCGPDSFLRHYVEEASGRPFLTLQFDGHGNDAGYLTRVEAYLDSKGVMRWWNGYGRCAI